jgi:hypothetical protein
MSLGRDTKKLRFLSLFFTSRRQKTKKIKIISFLTTQPPQKTTSLQACKSIVSAISPVALALLSSLRIGGVATDIIATNYRR